MSASQAMAGTASVGSSGSVELLGGTVLPRVLGEQLKRTRGSAEAQPC